MATRRRGNLTGKTDRKNQTIAYTRDNDSRLTQVTDATGTYQLTFDNMGRLTGTTTQYSFLTGRNFTTAYNYDAASNRVGFTDPEGGNTTYAYDTLNRLQTLTPPTAISTPMYSGLRDVSLFGDLHRWLSVETFEGCKTLFRYHLSEEEYSKLQSDFIRKKKGVTQPSVL